MQSRAMREYAARRGWTIAVNAREVGSGAARREARGERGQGAANGSRTEGCQFSPVQLCLSWLSFQYRWYSGIRANTSTKRRRHSAVTAQFRAEGRGRDRCALQYCTKVRDST